MNLFMSGLEHSLASIELREQLSFTKAKTAEMAKKIRSFPGVAGCVLISTCNRTEVYVSAENTTDPGRLLCQAAGVSYDPYQAAFLNCSGDDALRHLMEVAAGLRSRIWGEDQIISQVKNAITIAREAGAADPVLETMFRNAIAAGKEVRTNVRLTALPTSAASMAVELLRRELPTLEGKTAMVIGNGEMGRLTASLLQQAGCQVSVTLRTYHHGETIVPYGCSVVPYEERFSHMENTEILVSATTSPHYTVTAEQLQNLSHYPEILIDLAIPRDIEPEVAALHTRLYNVDDLGDYTRHREIPADVEAILTDRMEQFHHWLRYRQYMQSSDSLKQAISQRVMLSSGAEQEMQEMVDYTVDKTVELLLGNLAEFIPPESLQKCESKIRAHTIGR